MPATPYAPTATLTTLRAALRLALPDATAWPNNTLDGWIADAIRFYSLEFPRRWRYTLSLTTGTQAYSLPGGHGFMGIDSVEYPSGETPQEYVEQVAERSAEFASGGDYYALRGVTDSTAIESDTAAGTIVFAETVATGESAIITYYGLHPIPVAADDDAQITVPTAHWEALFAFVDFRAHWELEVDEATTPEDSPSTVHLSQLGEEGRRAWNRFKEVMNVLASQEAGRSSVLPWWPGSAI